ncbi:MAG: hypothetical protein RR595_10890 [Lysinibacillus sp.]
MTAKEGVVIPKERLINMLEVLKEIELITQNLTELNSTYEKIHQLACKGLKK